ncbi:MAG: hypothetical protein AAF039_16015 [Bacteroidota bacterium]
MKRNDLIFSGNLNRRVGFYHTSSINNDQGESIDAPQLLLTRFAYREDVGGEEELDGQLVAMQVCRFFIRFDKVIAANATALFIRDFDGDWDVTSYGITGSRKRYMELKCVKRGQNFTI